VIAVKFRLSETFVIDTDSPPWKTEGLRIGLWGGSGSGKSSTAALFAEQFLTQGGTVVIFEPRAEYHTLKEKWDIVVCGGPYAKDIDFIPTSPSTYAKAVIEQGVSVVFYTTDVEDETKLIEFISRFLYYLLKYNETVKRPIMLIVEETHEYAPMSTKGRVSPPWVFSRMIKSFKTASIDARKLNIVPIALSPRPQEVNFTIRQLCNLTFYGKFSPQDVHYIESQCLKYYDHSFYRGKDLLDLNTGQFAVITSGQTLPLQTITQPRLTKHGAETPKLTYIAPHKEETKNAVDSLTKTITDALERERQEETELERVKKQLADAIKDSEEKDSRIRELETALTVAGKLKVEMPPAPAQKPVTVTISEGTVVSPSVSTTLPTSNIPHLTNRRNLGDALRELLKTPYCYERNGLIPEEIMDVLRQNAIPFNSHNVRSWLWWATKSGKVRRTREGNKYRYWIA